MEARADQLRSRLDQKVQETISTLQRIWEEAGYENKECIDLLEEFFSKMATTCDNELSEEQRILEHARKEVETKLSEYIKLNDQLGRKIDQSMMFKHCTNLAGKLGELDRIIAEVTAEVTNRQQLLDVEHVAIAVLVTALGNDHGIPSSESQEDLPLSDARLQSLRRERAALETLRFKRTTQMQETAQECCRIIEELHILEEQHIQTTHFPLLEMVIRRATDGAGEFGVNLQDVAQLSEEYNSLCNERDARRIELVETGAQIGRLWTLLRIPASDRERFQTSFQHNLSLDTLNKGRQELVRLLSMRTTELPRIVGAIRTDIADLWEELGVTLWSDQMQEFPAFFEAPENLHDSSVEEHDQFCQLLRARVEELRPLLQRIAKREAVVKERVELEHLMDNPDRLTARNQSAREDRKREEAMSMRVKNLEKLTKEILASMLAWEEEHGTAFMYQGQRYAQHVVDQEEEFLRVREHLREARRMKKTVSTEAGAGQGLGVGGSHTLGYTTGYAGMSTPGKPIPISTSAKKNTTSVMSQSLGSPRKDPAPVLVLGGTSKLANACGPVSISAVDLMARLRLQKEQQTAQKLQLQQQREQDENRFSNDSDETDVTQYTSATEVRDEASTCTAVKKNGYGKGRIQQQSAGQTYSQPQA